MPNAPTVTEVARNFAEFVNRVFYRGERFVLMRGGRPVAELRPVPTGVRLAELPALFASLPALSEAEAEAFAADLDAARTALGTEIPRDPWEADGSA